MATLQKIATTTSRIGFRVLRFAYVWTGLVIFIPLLFAILLELYLLMPLHTYLNPSESHVVHFIQDWTLGFLYARLAFRLIMSDRTSRPARAFAAVVANGHLDPDARIATRCFLLPASSLFALAVAWPSAFAFGVSKTVYAAASVECKQQVWRFSFPTVGIWLVAAWAGYKGIVAVRRWRAVVRDEVYLVGERLHNFGERRAPSPPLAPVVPAVGQSAQLEVE